MITPQRQHALRSNFGLVFLACVALLAPPLALAQECVAREVSCCAALLSSKGFNMNPLGPLKLPSASAATHCTQTCVFSEKVAINNAASVTTTFGSVAGGDFAESQFSTRILNDVDGTPSACGASLDENTNRITLEIGTYLIEGICPFASSQPSACRLAKIDANTGAVVETLAVGTQGICRPPTEGSTSTASGYPRVANNAESTFLAHEVTFTEAATVVLQSFLGDALVTDMNGGYANVANDRQNHGLSGAFGARLSVRKIPQSRAGSTCVSTQLTVCCEKFPKKNTVAIPSSRLLHELGSPSSARIAPANATNRDPLTMKLLEIEGAAPLKNPNAPRV